MTAQAKVDTSPFLQGLLAPVLDERDDQNLEVAGDLPRGLKGIFVRNGPNPQFAPMDAYHPFDGDGMLHAVYFEEGGVRYRNRWVQSAGLLAERKRGRACYGSISQFRLPEEDVVADGGFLKNTANTHVVRHAGHYFALLEAAKPTEFSRQLETIGEYDFAGKLSGPMTAHPKLDPKTGELVFFGYSPMPPFLQYHVADASGVLVHSEIIDVPAPVMMHDFAVTDRHAIFLYSPAIFDLEAMMRGEPGIRWEPERGTKLGVLPRRGGNADVRWFEIDPCYVVHFFNAFEADGKIEIYAPRFDRMPGGLQFDSPEQTEEPFPWHWTIDLAASTVRGEQTDDRAGEFPRINDTRAGLRHRYMYNTMARNWEFGFDFNAVIKYDLQGGAAQSYTYGDTTVVGEHLFVPNPEATGEDDGWVMTIASDRLTEKSELLVLDARQIDRGPIARVKMPRRVPIGFHANWFAE